MDVGDRNGKYAWSEDALHESPEQQRRQSTGKGRCKGRRSQAESGDHDRLLAPDAVRNSPGHWSGECHAKGACRHRQARQEFGDAESLAQNGQDRLCSVDGQESTETGEDDC